MSFFETSAKNNSNITTVFEELVGQILKKINCFQPVREVKGSFYLKKQTKKKKCCK